MLLLRRALRPLAARTLSTNSSDASVVAVLEYVRGGQVRVKERGVGERFFY